MPAYGVPMRMAQRHKQGHCLVYEPTRKITNSDHEMAGLLLIWLVIEGVCMDLRKKCITLFSDNSSTVGGYHVWLPKTYDYQESRTGIGPPTKSTHACPLTLMHIEGKRNGISDMPSQSFGNNPVWHCSSDSDLLFLFNSLFLLPSQQSWTVYRQNCALVMGVTSALQMQPFALDDWRWLPKAGGHFGQIGAPMSNLWEWIHTYSRCLTNSKSAVSQALLPGPGPDTMEKDDRSRVAQSLVQSRSLSRQSLWPAKTTQPK
jgi:hypothetical protein